MLWLGIITDKVYICQPYAVVYEVTLNQQLPSITLTASWYLYMLLKQFYKINTVGTSPPLIV